MNGAPSRSPDSTPPRGRACAALAALLGVGLALPAMGAGVASATERFSFYGLSPAAAGQPLAQAEAALGQPLKSEPRAAKAAAPAASAAAPRCHYRSAERQPGVRYAVDGEVITRIETRDARYATVSGVHVGDTAERALQVYGKRLNSAPHPYFDRGRVLTVYSPDRKFALVMEANDQGRIITLRGGRLPEVGWLEGCS